MNSVKHLQLLFCLMMMYMTVASGQESETKELPKQPVTESAGADKQSTGENSETDQKTKVTKAENPGEAKNLKEATSDAEKEEPKKESPVKLQRKKLSSIGYENGTMIRGQQWRVHDLNRPRPRAITPGTQSTFDKPGSAPSDAIVLFDGKDLTNWGQMAPGEKDGLYVPEWKVENGYMEITPGTGSLRTLDTFGSCQLHIEWASPAKPEGESQNRGNSGVILMGRYEIQVLDSYNNRTYADGQAGAVYGQHPPMVNATRQSGQWQVYDIVFKAPNFEEGKLSEPANVTVIHNGVLLHHGRQLVGQVAHKDVAGYKEHQPAGPIVLQDHGSPVRFRNIWIRPL